MRWTEAAVATAAVAVCVVTMASPAAAIALLPYGPPLLIPLVAWIAVQDVATLTIPDGAVLATGAIGLALRFPVDPVELAADIALSGGALYAVREAFWRWRGLDALGFGDVKLAAAGGVLVGAAGFSVALLAASVTGLLLALLGALFGRPVGRGTKLPFGALLAPALLLVAAAGP